jgi:hypothetical protein
MPDLVRHLIIKSIKEAGGCDIEITVNFEHLCHDM